MNKTKGTTRKRKQIGRGNIQGNMNNKKIRELRIQADKIRDEMKPFFDRSEKDIERTKLNKKMEKGDIISLQKIFDAPLSDARSTRDIEQNKKMLQEKGEELKKILDEIAILEVNTGGKIKRRRKTKRKRSI
jgi:hypothetical protein